MKTKKPVERMYVCEVETAYQTNSGIEYRWKKVDVELTANTDRVRCAHCAGSVRFHRKQKANGTPDHVEHRSRQDSEYCMGGHYFKGDHHRSQSPVE
jgi:hypothetical protein